MQVNTALVDYSIISHLTYLSLDREAAVKETPLICDVNIYLILGCRLDIIYMDYIKIVPLVHTIP